MPEIQSALASIRDALAAFHPLAPWILLAAICVFATLAAERLGWLAKLERAVPWGKLATATAKGLPAVILGAAWPAVTSGDTDPSSAVKGALAGVLAPVVLAVWQWLPKPPGSGGGVVAIVLLTLGCSDARHPDRDACYLTAETRALQRGVTECADYPSTDECPAWPGIEADMQREQEVCK